MNSLNQSRRGIWWLWLTAILIAVDQWSKFFTLQHLLPTDVVRWTSFFDIRLAFNTGASFGFLADGTGWQTTFFSLVAIVAAIILIIWLYRLRYNDYLLCIALSMILAGAVGNLIDRIRLSYVIDFFSFHVGAWHFDIFNVADSCITVGVILLLAHLLFSKNRNAA